MYPTSLTAAQWATLEQLILGQAPATAAVVNVGWNAMGVALNMTLPVPPVPAPAPTPTPGPAKTVKSLSRAEGAQVCRAMVSFNGDPTKHKQAIGSFDWASLLQLIEEILAAVIPGLIPATP
jgi:hypothetical protein